MRHMMRDFFSSRSATAAIEFAFVAPIVLILLAGTVEVGRAYQVYSSANRLATQFANVYADCSDTPAGTCSSELNYYMTPQIVANLAPQLTSSALVLNMFQVKMSGTQPVIVYVSPAGSTLTGAQIAAAQAVLTDGQNGVIVTATYSHTLTFFSGAYDDGVVELPDRVIYGCATQVRLSHTRPRLSCLNDTFRPSHRQLRSTHFLFAVQPALCSIAVMRRYPYRPYGRASATMSAINAA